MNLTDVIANFFAANDFDSQNVVVALSGGADSLSLTLSLHEWMKDSGGHLHACYIDHGLRGEAAKEAEWLAQCMHEQAISYESRQLSPGLYKSGNTLEKAREGRYAALIDVCRQKNSQLLFVGHHLDDQVETMLMRLRRGTGLRGLCGMQPISKREGISICRPFLDIEKWELQQYLRNRQQTWIEDPSNQNTTFDRIKIRTLWPIMEELGFTKHRLAALAQHAKTADDALEFYAQQAFKDCFTDNTLNLDSFQTLPEDIRYRLLVKSLMHVSGSEKIIRFESLERLYKKLGQDKNFKITLADCIIERKGQILCLSREKMS